MKEQKSKQTANLSASVRRYDVTSHEVTYAELQPRYRPNMAVRGLPHSQRPWRNAFIYYIYTCSPSQA